MGDRMLQLSTEDGGGWRKVKLHNDDDFSEIFKKILDVYFPRKLLIKNLKHYRITKLVI
jgi:hypothetical protein